MEIIVSIFVMALILTAIYQLFVYFGREAERPMASMSMEQTTLQVVRWLQRDIADTNLQSIRSLPNAANPSSFPALVMESPRDDKDALVMSAFGTVQWKKYVYYQVVPVPGKPGVGELTYEEDGKGVNVEPEPPASLTVGTTSRHRVLAGNVAIGSAGEHKGFYAYWTDNLGNKHDFEDAATARGEPVNVEITLTDLSARTGKPTLRKLLIQVKPQN